METIFKRKIYNKLLTWKEDNKSFKQTGLIIKGSRQVGKTTIVKEFARNNYEHVVYINFMYDTKYKECFNGDLNVDSIITQLSFYNNEFIFEPNKTIIIFDEIQDCPKAKSSIKPFCLDGRFDIICAGSLLGIMGYSDNSNNISNPVGFESHLTMYPMDFEEYLWALGYDSNQLEYLSNKVNKLEQIEESIHNKMLDEFKLYMFVGGMPDAVLRYIQTKNINLVRQVQQNILNSYRSDFGKHLNSNQEPKINNWDKAKLNRLFDSIPVQLSRETKNGSEVSTKFKFKDVKENAKFRDYIDAITWLKDAGIINVCHNLKCIQEPIKNYIYDNQFKIYMNDTGLFMSCLSERIIQSINSSDFGTYKCYIYENIIADQLAKNGIELFYYCESSFEKEIDFVTSDTSSIYVIDVKSSKSKVNSLYKIVQSSSNTIKGIKLSRNNIGLNNSILTLPYYLAYLITPDFKFELR